ncbi:MAG: type II secretion system protein [Planctomycetota bacterium]|nr:type II secretion system protein [Planctomycetota bacterium]
MVNHDSRMLSARDGFTLIELVMALAIIGGSFLTLLYMRTDAVDRAFNYNHQRLVERVARELLDEAAFGISEGLDGTAQLPGSDSSSTGWPWSAIVTDLSTEETGPRLLEITLTLEYPGPDLISSEEYVLTTRVLVDADDPLATNAQTLNSYDNGAGF